LIEKVFELRIVALEADRRRVGEVVGDGAKARVLRAQSGFADPVLASWLFASQ
jgi:hypothetical protein